MANKSGLPNGVSVGTSFRLTGGWAKTVCCVICQIINASQNVARRHKLATENKIKIKQHGAKPRERQGRCVVYGD